MNAPVVAFFNNKGGVGKTSLVFHLAWMYADIGLKVLAADLDPQANLTAAFLEDERLEEFWSEGEHGKTIYGSIEPLLLGVGDIVENPYAERIDERIHLLLGDLALTRFEDEFSVEWTQCLDRKERAFRVISAFWRVINRIKAAENMDIVLVDLGPNLGAINRAILVAADYLAIPLVPDFYSLPGLKNLGSTIMDWRAGWRDRRDRNPVKDLRLPDGRMEPIGYVVMQHAEKLGRPVRAHERWAKRIPEVYSKEMLGKEAKQGAGPNEHQLGLIRHYRSLMPMAQEAHKPIFHLRPADGAIGSLQNAVMDARDNFKQLAFEIAKRCDVAVP